MARLRRYAPRDELNLTPLRALPLLIVAKEALASENAERRFRALRDCADALEKHVKKAIRRAGGR